eukprot:Lankesteria_metandrocarpae@DN2987_c1_g1_i1.p1
MQHTRRTCQYLNTVCAHCHRIGHIASACKTWVQKDQQGRITQRVEPSASKVTFETRQDATNETKLTTAIDSLSLFLQKMMQSSEAASARRKEKETIRRTDEGLPPRRQQFQRPTDPSTITFSQPLGESTVTAPV